MERHSVRDIPQLIGALGKMAEYFGLAQVDADRLFSTPKQGEASLPRRCAVRSEASPLKLTIAEHFTPTADAIVCDDLLGSLAFVHFPVQNGEDLRKYIIRRIDAAAYARHLLLEALRPEAGQAPRSPFVVEVVFMIPGEDKGSRIERCMGEVLRALARDASILMGLGVNVWREEFDAESHMRRAFPWFLHETKQWYASRSRTDDASGGTGNKAAGAVKSAVRRLDALTMKHFRVAGERTWTLDAKHALHIVRGYNGTGKSSIVEALELAATGRVERIANHPTQHDHQKVITNRHDAAAGVETASLVLRFVDGESHALTVTPAGASAVLSTELLATPATSGSNDTPPPLNAAAFRMHQALEDQLSQGTPEVRGRILMEAFFPEHSGRLNELDDRQAQFNSAVRQLPGWLRESLPRESPSTPSGTLEVSPQQTAHMLDWLGTASSPWVVLREFLVLKPADHDALKPLLSDAFCAAYDASDTVGKNALDRAAELNRELDSLFHRPAELADPIATLQKLLEKYPGTEAPPTGDVASAAENRLNTWLELVALCDVHEREDRLLSTLELASEYRYSFQSLDEPLLKNAPPLQAETRRARLRGLRGRRDLARRALDSSAEATVTRSADGSLPKLTLADEKLLDAAARFGLLGNDLRGARLGAALRTALQTGAPVPLKASEKELAVGQHGWTRSLHAALATSKVALERLNTLQAQRMPDGANEPVHWFPADIEARLSKVRATADALSKTGSDVVHEVEKLLGRQSPLGRALNELMSLFTPARWAYEDLVSEARIGNGTRAVELAVGGDASEPGVPAQLRWNAAELTACAISLFLLCARTTRNPYGLIVLDDPLQSMDELTVVSVARGIGRLLRLWNQVDGNDNTWRVVVLLHSEEHLERIRQEVPCAVYLLQWLTPEQTPSNAAAPSNMKAAAGDATKAAARDTTDTVIKRVPSHLDTQLQSLHGLITAHA